MVSLASFWYIPFFEAPPPFSQAIKLKIESSIETYETSSIEQHENEGRNEVSYCVKKSLMSKSRYFHYFLKKNILRMFEVLNHSYDSEAHIWEMRFF